MRKLIGIRCNNCNKTMHISKSEYAEKCREWGVFYCPECGEWGEMEPDNDIDDVQWKCINCKKWIDDRYVRGENDWDNYDATYNCPECDHELMSQDDVDEERAEFADGTVNGLRQDAEGNWCYDLDYPEDE